MSKQDIIEKVRHSGLVPMPVYGNTYDLAAKVMEDGIPGDLVECGVFAGAQAAVMAQAVRDASQLSRMVHLFDSFNGIPEAGPMDDGQPGRPDAGEKLGRLVSSGVSVCTLDTVRANLLRWGVPEGMFACHVGWFQDTVPLWPPDEPIALLRLDGDLYESTLVCLRHLYPKVPSGGICIVDDCNLGGCVRAIRDYFGRDIPKREVVPDGDGCEWWVKK